MIICQKLLSQKLYKFAEIIVEKLHFHPHLLLNQLASHRFTRTVRVVQQLSWLTQASTRFRAICFRGRLDWCDLTSLENMNYKEQHVDVARLAKIHVVEECNILMCIPILLSWADNLMHKSAGRRSWILGWCQLRVETCCVVVLSLYVQAICQDMLDMMFSHI